LPDDGVCIERAGFFLARTRPRCGDLLHRLQDSRRMVRLLQEKAAGDRAGRDRREARGVNHRYEEITLLLVGQPTSYNRGLRRAVTQLLRALAHIAHWSPPRGYELSRYELAPEPTTPVKSRMAASHFALHHAPQLLGDVP
jgi:hypothetical protein